MDQHETNAKSTPETESNAANGQAAIYVEILCREDTQCP